jgi:DnaJ-class molecular chaperone
LFDTALKYIHDVIKKAYRKLAKEYHPYKSKGNEVKFTEIADAYKTLSHPNKKARFDQARNNPFGQGFGGDKTNSAFEDLLNNQHFARLFFYYHCRQIVIVYDMTVVQGASYLPLYSRHFFGRMLTRC